MPQHLHLLAIGLFVIVAGQNLVGVLRRPIGGELEFIIQPIFALTVWSFLMWKLCTKPRKWGFGIGIFFLLMISFQTHFLIKASADPKLIAGGADFGWRAYIASELPLAIAAIACLALKWYGPEESDPAETE